MLKKVLAGVLAIAMICVFAAACGGGSSDSGGSQPAPASSPPASSPPAQQAAPPAANNSGGNSAADEDDYEEVMLEFKEAFEYQLRLLDEMIDYADNGFDSEEELVDWCVGYITLKNAIAAQADVLADALPGVPEYFLEAHMNVTFAVAAVVDAMTGFENVIDAYTDGDEDAFWDGLVEFVGFLELASDLWHEAYA